MKETSIESGFKKEIQIQAEQNKQFKFYGSTMPKQGHSLFKYNTVTNTLSKAKFSSKDVHVSIEKGSTSGRKKVIMEENCIYVHALNWINAIKHLRNMSGLKNLNPIIQKHE
jgi:hypothetical protein